MMTQLREMAEDLHALRPDWDLGGILTALTGLQDRGAGEQLAAAAIAAATDPTARTPTAIGFSRYWQTPPTTPATDEPKFTGPLPECANCGQPRQRVRDRTQLLPPPTRCPRCGAPWIETVPHDTRRDDLEATCPTCSRRQRPGFPYCIDCGAPMNNPDAEPPAAADREDGQLTAWADACTGVLDHITNQPTNERQAAINRRGRALCQAALDATGPPEQPAQPEEANDDFVAPF